MYLLGVLVSVLLFATCVKGDILVVQNMGNTIIPRQESDISMDTETVWIMPVTEGAKYPSGYMVSCEFVLTNHSTQTVARDVAFPVSHPDYGRTLARHFRVSVEENGQWEPVKTELKMVVDRDSLSWADVTYWEAPHDTFKYPGYVVWEQTLAPGQTQAVHCEYPMGQPQRLFPNRPFKGRVFEYVVRTGALWKGKIGEATINLDLGPGAFDPESITSDHEGITMTYRDSVRCESSDTLVWHFNNWEPTEDIMIAFTTWAGYDVNEIARNGYRLPHPYIGAREEYDEEYLNRLVEQEILRVAKYYPKRAEDTDTEFLRSMIAECLFYELFARHGDPFIPGPIAKYSRFYTTIRNGFVVSPWHGYFRGYSYHGGWYQWYDRKTRKPNSAVKPEDLSLEERRNAAFLRKFIRSPLVR
jgi:hypothetical protein